MSSQDSELLYSTTESASGDLIVLYRGAEVGTAADLEEAAVIAAEDAIAGWPEVCQDILVDVAYDMNENVANVIHDEEFAHQVAQYIARRWVPETSPSRNIR